MEVVVFGAGSLGSLIGGLLAGDHEVTLVGREAHVAAIRESGLRVTGAVERRVHPDAVAHLDRGGDLAVVTVKAYDTETAARELAGREFDAALSLQNGVGNEAALAARLSCPVLAGVATYGARVDGPGVVECTGVGEVTLGPREGGTTPAARRVGEAFRAAGIAVEVAADMPRRLHEKLTVNAGVNPVTAMAGVTNGALRDGPGGDLAERAAREAAEVARSEGVDLAGDEAVEALRSVVEATAGNVSSMRQDVEAGRRTEIDAINGYVVEHADTTVPVNRTLAGLVRAWEAGRGLR